ncbi:MAG: hypothetical protein Q9226_003252 [Calogaya cf. arnoldii]
MATNFFSLPREIRDQIYGLVLLQQEPIDPFNNWRQQQLTPGLLRANKTVHQEASSQFYAQNYIEFSIHTSNNVAPFFRQIGRNNANYIRHIDLDFPDFQCLNLNNVALADGSAGILAIIQSSCANLSTLTMGRSMAFGNPLLAAGVDPNVITEALELIDTHIRAIASLQEVAIDMYDLGSDDHGGIDHVRKEMERHGWTIHTAIRSGNKSDEDSGKFVEDDHE